MEHKKEFEKAVEKNLHSSPLCDTYHLGMKCCFLVHMGSSDIIPSIS